MAISVLIVTPSPGFGELIRQTLEEAGSFAVALETNGREAIQRAKEGHYAVCIMDADCEDMPADELVFGLKEALPELRLVLIPPENDQEDTDYAGLQADSYLSKPFYLPDLLSTVEEVLEQSGMQKPPPPAFAPEPTVEIQQPAEAVSPSPDWLQDVSRAAQHLTRLSLESAAQASLITRGSQLWAYAGQLPQPAADELAQAVAHYWAHDGGSDLARFVRLEATGGEYMLYATSLGGDFVLALVFEASTPFSKIRAQAGNLAQALASGPNAEMPELEPLISTEDSQPAPLPSQPLLDDVPPPIPADWRPDQVPSLGRQSFLEELLDDEGIPASPSVLPLPLNKHEPNPSQPLPVLENDMEFENPPAMHLPSDQESEVDLDVSEPQPEIELDAPSLPSPDPIVETVASQVELSEEIMAETIPSQIDISEEAIADTMPSKISRESKDKILEPVSPALYNLTYACVLIPRIPKHHLTGDLATRLAEWVTQLCLAFGWRLEHLAVRPDYLQWIVNVPPTTSPGYLMRIMRQHTSRRLFTEFPRMERDNPSGDFWAPGYLIMSGTQPPSHLIKDFIQQTRQRQGVSKKD